MALGFPTFQATPYGVLGRSGMNDCQRRSGGFRNVVEIGTKLFVEVGGIKKNTVAVNKVIDNQLVTGIENPTVLLGGVLGMRYQYFP